MSASAYTEGLPRYLKKIASLPRRPSWVERASAQGVEVVAELGVLLLEASDVLVQQLELFVQVHQLSAS